MSRRPTAADVAAAADVSRSTVSYILNGSDRQSFSAETVARVRAAAAQLGYTPHPAARALRRGESGIVLLAIPDLPWGSNLDRLISALTDGVRATGRSMVTLALRPDNHLADALRDISPQALLEVIPFSQEDRAAARALSLPVISVATPLERLDHAAVALQVQHLAALGHRRLGVLAPGEAGVEVFSRSRLKGVRQAAADLGLPEPEVVVTDGADDASVRAVAEVLERWTSARVPVTGICCFNDMFAAVAVAAADRVGLDVPRDLSVVGIDDEVLAGLLRPSLTTIRYDFGGVGSYVRDQLACVLDAGPPAAAVSSTLLELIPRRSTAPPVT